MKTLSRPQGISIVGAAGAPLEPFFRPRSVAVVGATEAAGSVDALQAVLGQADTETRLYAAEALSRITPESADAVQILIAALESTERESRWLGAVALAGVAPPHRGAAVAALTTALQDPDPEICAVAALTLGGFGGEAGMAVPHLERALSHPFEDVRMAAETALACIVR